MSGTRIKICGITSPEDARACHALGADYLGVIFAESARQISPERAGEIHQAVPEARLVGVFADADLRTIQAAARLASLSLIQLHGRESDDFCRTVREETALPVIKAVRPADLTSPPALVDQGAVDLPLFDLEKDAAARTEDILRLWSWAGTARRAGYRIVLAGRLSPETVRLAVAQVSPFCVDVSRGVEKAPGVKDTARVRQFIAEVRG